MKKFILFVIIISCSIITKAQVADTVISPNTHAAPVTEPGKKYNKLDLSTRANDHFLIQYGFDGWAQTPDSINTSGFSRHFNFYLMIDKPFITSPKLSIGYGLGFGSSNIFFSDTYIDIKSNTTTLPFEDVSEADHFKKYKLTTAFLEIPLEFRFSSNPAQPDKGFKAAVGVKGGYLLTAYTKGKNFVDSSGRSVYDSRYIEKEYLKRFFNSTRFALTARVGYGHISLDGSYQVTGILKDGAGPTINPWSIGITLSGL